MKRRNASGIAAVLAAGTFYGLNGVCCQYLFTSCGVDFRFLAPIRLLGGGLFLLLLSFIKYGRSAFAVWQTRQDAAQTVLTGVAGIMLMQLGYLATVSYSNAATASVLQNTAPVMLLITECVMRRKAPDKMEVLAVLMAVTGVFLLATHASLSRLAISPVALAIGLAAAVAVVLYSLLPRHLMEKYPTEVILGWGMLLGGAVLTAVFRPLRFAPTPALGTIAGICFVLLCGTALTFFLYSTGIRLIGATRASVYELVEPIVAAIGTALILGTHFALWDLAGFALILIPILLLSRDALRPIKQ